MQIVIALYDRFTALDAVGPHQVLAHVPGAEIIFASERARAVSDETGTLTLVADASYADVPAPDVLLVPGGPGQSARSSGAVPAACWPPGVPVVFALRRNRSRRPSERWGPANRPSSRARR